MKVAIQGIAGCFHEMAAKKFFNSTIETVSCPSFKVLCDLLENKEVDFAIMAIENTLAGSLLPNYSLLRDYNFNIIGEEYLRISMCLMALPTTKIENIKFVQSHPVALEQCKQFLWSLPNIAIKEHEDTAAAAKEVKDKQLTDHAAIGNAYSAELYDLKILQRDIQSNDKNFTRFLIMSNQPKSIDGHNKASIGFQLNHESGSLASLLTEVAACGINLSKLQSIPVIGKPYEYRFYADLEYKDKDEFEKVWPLIQSNSNEAVVYGNYKKGILPDN